MIHAIMEEQGLGFIRAYNRHHHAEQHPVQTDARQDYITMGWTLSLPEHAQPVVVVFAWTININVHAQ